jgi:hypothetical protein
MPGPLFEFFEIIAEELSIHGSSVITPDSIKAKDLDSSLLEDLKREYRAIGAEEAIKVAVEELRKHFKAKGSELPFEYAPATGVFTAKDAAFLTFIKDMGLIRGIGKRSRDFECRVTDRLRLRATGEIHRVGHPRDIKKKKKEFNAHLQTLGFDRPVLLGKEKDGGFDILWQLPLGTTRHRPLVSVQCKNGKFDMRGAQASVGVGSTSLSQHGGLQPSVHVPCVLFNDYLGPYRFTEKQLNFVPLGLSDLATLEKSVSVEFI